MKYYLIWWEDRQEESEIWAQNYKIVFAIKIRITLNIGTYILKMLIFKINRKSTLFVSIICKNI